MRGIQVRTAKIDARKISAVKMIRKIVLCCPRPLNLHTPSPHPHPAHPPQNKSAALLESVMSEQPERMQRSRVKLVSLQGD